MPFAPVRFFFFFKGAADSSLLAFLYYEFVKQVFGEHDKRHVRRVWV